MLPAAQFDKQRNDKLRSIDDVDEGDSVYATTMTTATDDIQYIETTNEWFQWCDKLAEAMFTKRQLRNTQLKQFEITTPGLYGYLNDLYSVF